MNKTLLLLLLMVALIGLWYVWTSNRSADESTVSTTTSTTETSEGSASTESTSSEAAQGGAATGSETGAATPENAPLGVSPDGPVDVEVIPPFPVQVGSSAQTDVPVVPKGINPDTALAGLPSSNPFRPLRLDPRDSGTTASATPAQATQNNTAQAPDNLELNPPVNPARGPVSTGNAAGSDISSGPVAITPIPGAGGAVSVPSASVSGGALPTPIIPGADGSTGSAGGVSVPGVAVTPLPTSSATVRPPSVTVRPPSVTGNPSAGNSVAVSPPAVVTPPAVKPPVAGVRVPSVPTVPGAFSSTSTGPGGVAGQNGAAAGGVAGTDGAGNVPATTTPQVITELGAASGAAPMTAASELDQLVQTQDLAFNAVVLGPVNTAIFRSRNGFLVVSVGQKLPDTDVTVKEVSADSATLALGNETKILELDKR